jgi:AraC-like DNA-binding protein/quercetin dioxygenase-like cupin family protein
MKYADPDTPDREIAALQVAPSRVVAASRALRAGQRIAAHRHARAQFVYTQRGLLHVETERAQWRLPAERALWIPPDVRHALQAVGATQIRTVYVLPASLAAPAMTLERAVRVTPLLHELVLRLLASRAVDERERPIALIVELLLLELARLPGEPLQLPMPRDDALLQRYVDAVLANIEADIAVADVAANAGISTRTFTRRFELATGLSPGRWKTQARLLRGIELLAAGHGVTETALAVGYQTPSAFTDAFGRSFGTSPARYLATTRR